MFDQAPLRQLEQSNGHQTGPTVSQNAGSAGAKRLIADIIELVELQGRLIASDVKCLAESILRPIIIAAVALLILMSALPVLLLSGSNSLARQLEWPPALVQLAVSGFSIVIAILMILLAVKYLTACGSPLNRSITELEKNMSTLRELVSGSSSFQSHLRELEEEDQAA